MDLQRQQIPRGITQGDLNERVEVKTNNEFVALSEGINSTVTALKEAIAEAAARIDAELEVARAIQRSSLPGVFSSFPGRDEFDVYATMGTAKEVGGDFYDFFLIGENRLAVVIADVSGKGIPASLFMMTTKTLLQNLTEAGASPEGLFRSEQIPLREQRNRDVRHRLHGHFGVGYRQVHLRQRGTQPRSLERPAPLLVEVSPGFVLGAWKGRAGAGAFFQAGDRLFLYTDGVTEPEPPGGVVSDLRLEETLNADVAERWT